MKRRASFISKITLNYEDKSLNNNIPDYVEGHNLLAGKAVLVTAAAGAGIGFAAAKRAAEEGATALMIADIHEGRLAKSADKLDQETCLLYTSPSPRDLSTSRMPSSA